MQRLISHVERWRFEYRGIEFEISKRDRKPTPFWAYYIFFPLDIMHPDLARHFWLEPEVQAGKRLYPLSKSDFLQRELSWHAGGPDYYEKIGGHDHDPRIAKIGCGFGGDWEKHIEYERDNLDWQARMTIDSFTRLALHGPSGNY